MTVDSAATDGTPLWIYGWFVLDGALALTPPLHWAFAGDWRVLGLPAPLFYFTAVALCICASLVAAYRAEVAAGVFDR